MLPEWRVRDLKLSRLVQCGEDLGRAKSRHFVVEVVGALPIAKDTEKHCETVILRV
jgi:hypothetical protein